MAQLVVAAAGAAIGGAIGGPMGAKLGWMAGSMLAGALIKPDPTQGPRVEDKKVSASTYGETIPTVWGTDRCKAQFLWASDLIEAEQDVGGGKGFGGAEGTVYTYSVNVLLSVCKSPFDRPRHPLRLWGNGRLIATFNGASWDVDKALIQRSGVREYIGAADQMPDPVYEAAVGVENAVAYRGQLSIMLEGLQLGDFGNRCPNFEVEVTSEIEVEGCPTAPLVQTDPQLPHLFTGSGGSGRFAAAYDAETGRYFVVSSDDHGTVGTKQLEVYRTSPGADPVLTQIIPLSGFSASSSAVGGMVFDPENRVLWIVAGYAGTRTLFSDAGPVAARVNVDTLATVYSSSRMAFYTEAGGGICGTPGNLVVCPSISRNWGAFPYAGATIGDAGTAGTGARYGAMLRIHPNSGAPLGEVSWGIAGSGIIMYRLSRLRNGEATLIHVEECPRCTITSTASGIGWHSGAAGASNYTGDVLYIPQADGKWLGGVNYQMRYDERIVTLVDEESALEVTGSTADGGRPFGGFSASRRKAFLLYGTDVAVIDLDFNTGDPTVYSSGYTELTSLTSTIGEPNWVVWSEYHDAFVAGRMGTLWMTVVVFDPETDEIIAGPCVYENFGGIIDGGLVGVNEIGSGYFVGISGRTEKIVTFKAPGARAMGGGILLSEIVSDVWQMSGGDAADIDVSELVDIVPGYTLARQAAGRGIIEPLRAAYFFDGVESGQTFKWPKRGKSSVATIDSGEMGAHVFQLTKSEPEPAYELEHIEELDAPRSLTLKYIDAEANYDPGTQIATRQVGGSPAPATMELPIVLNTNYAARVAWTNLLIAHASKDPIKFSLSHAYEHLEPADAITVPLANGEHQRIVITNRVSARPLVEFEGVIEDPAVWDAVLPGVDRGQLPRQNAPAARENTVLEVLDLPPLRAEDDRIVAYFAMSRAMGEGWPGGSAYRSTDDGATYSVLYSTSAEATMGYTTAELAAWTKGNFFDRENTVRVWLRRGTLSSASRDAVLNGANAAVIGNEIIQFQNATLIGENEWQIDTLLRHRIGTEWAARSAHATGSRFVLLSAAALRAIEYSLSDMNVARLYKAVTAGQALAEGNVGSETLIGNSIKPLAPVHVRGTRDGSGNLAATWIGRARINADWRDEFDVPLDESSEQYRVDVFSDANRATVKRTVEVTAAAWTYTDADQMADFGSLQSTVYLAVYQITPTYNALGHAAEVSL